MTPLDVAGVYVPGGKAVYPSSVLMNILPAKVAGVDEIVMVTPPGKDGKVNVDSFLNSLRQTLQKIQLSGIAAVSEHRETDSQIVLTITIPK